MAEVYVKRSDTAPAFRAILKDANDDPVPLTEDDGLRFVMSTQRGDVYPWIKDVVIDGTPTLGDSTGEVVYQWEPGDTDVAGGYIAEVEVTFEDGTKETFPNDREGFSVAIVKDLVEAS